MVNFEELRILAVEKHKKFHEYKDEINLFASKLLFDFAEYLGVRQFEIQRSEVDRNLEPIESPKFGSVNTCFCYDTFWYFELVINFPFVKIPIDFATKNIITLTE